MCSCREAQTLGDSRNEGLQERGRWNVMTHESPNKARVVKQPSIASFHERMIKAQQGLLECQSLEDSCFVADGEDLSGCEF
jgi:hypothetical protein